LWEKRPLSVSRRCCEGRRLFGRWPRPRLVDRAVYIDQAGDTLFEVEDVRFAADARGKARTAHRINHTSTYTHDPRMSAVRKLVIYRSFNGLDEGAAAA